MGTGEIKTDLEWVDRAEDRKSQWAETHHQNQAIKAKEAIKNLHPKD